MAKFFNFGGNKKDPLFNNQDPQSLKKSVFKEQGKSTDSSKFNYRNAPVPTSPLDLEVGPGEEYARERDRGRERRGAFGEIPQPRDTRKDLRATQKSLFGLSFFALIPPVFWGSILPFLEPLLREAQAELLTIWNDIDLLPTLPDAFALPPEFPKSPTRPQTNAYIAQGTGNTVETNKHLCWMQRRRHVDHRQQYEAVAIANGTHPRVKFLEFQALGTSVAKAFYSYWDYDRFSKTWEIKLCTVSWNDTSRGDVWVEFWKDWAWGGAPPDKSDLTAGQYMITWATWCTFFKLYVTPAPGSWNGFSCSEHEIPCELGDHKAGDPNNPYGPDGCLRVPDPNVLDSFFGDGEFYIIFTSGVSADTTFSDRIHYAEFYLFISGQNYTLTFRYQTVEGGTFINRMVGTALVFAPGVAIGNPLLYVRISRDGVILKEFGPRRPYEEP